MSGNFVFSPKTADFEAHNRCNPPKSPAVS